MLVELGLYAILLGWYGVLVAWLVGLVVGLALGVWLVLRFCSVESCEVRYEYLR